MDNVNRITKLKGEYKGLSRASEFFPRTSRHKAFIHMDRRMNEILGEIKILQETAR